MPKKGFTSTLVATLLLLAVSSLAVLVLPSSTAQDHTTTLTEPTTTLSCTTTKTITGSGETIPVGNCVVYATCTATLTATYTGTLPILIPPGECVVNAQTTVACTNTITVTLTVGQPPPPLAVPLPGSCYAFVTVGQSPEITYTAPTPSSTFTCPAEYTPVSNQSTWGCQTLTPLQGNQGQPSNTIIKALKDFWNWLRCLFGRCS